jgi:glycosyltransferase involved in cell wall biosynthesis
MKLLVLTIGDPESGSTKYRIVQYEDYLRNNGIEISYVHRDDICARTLDLVAKADVVLNQKCLFNASLSRKIIATAKRVIFDFDDAIWTRPGRPHSFLTRFKVRQRFQPWLKNADLILAANDYLGSYARKFTDRVLVLPMSLDLRQWHPAPREDDGVVRIGWAGSPGNLKYLKQLDDVLSRITGQYANVRVMVYCGKKPELHCPFEYTKFQPGTEAAFTQRLDIGLLPLEDEEYLRGKSPIKAIQYLACGVPVAGNIYGATAEIASPQNSLAISEASDWFQSLSLLIENRTQRKQMGQAGLEFIRATHDMSMLRHQLLALIKGGQE